MKRTTSSILFGALIGMFALGCGKHGKDKIVDYFPITLHKIKHQESMGKSKDPMAVEIVETKESADGTYADEQTIFKGKAGYRDLVMHRIYLVSPYELDIVMTEADGMTPKKFSGVDAIHLRIPGKTDSDSWVRTDAFGGEQKLKVYYGSIKTKYGNYPDCLVKETVSQSLTNAMPDVEKEYFARGIGWVYTVEGDISFQLIDK